MDCTLGRPAARDRGSISAALVRLSLLAYGKYAARPQSSQINESETPVPCGRPLNPELLDDIKMDSGNFCWERRDCAIFVIDGFDACGSHNDNQ